MSQKQKAELLDGFILHTTDKNLKENFLMLKQKVNSLPNEKVSQTSEAPATDRQHSDGHCDYCGSPLLPVPVKAVAIKSCAASITEGRQYDIVRHLENNIIVIDDTGMEIGFSDTYLKPIIHG